MRKVNIVLVTLALISSVFIGCTGETSVKKNQFVGTWFSNEEGLLFIFDDSGSLREISLGAYRVSTYNYKYSVKENESCIEIQEDGAGSVVVCDFDFPDNDRLVLSRPGYYENGRQSEFTRVKDSDGKGNPIVGTWTAVDRDSFDFHINHSSYDAKSLSFYNDGTFRVVTNGGEGFGKYTFLFDGEVLQMQDHRSRGEFDYELFGDEFMLIEFSIYNGEMQFGYLLTKE